MLRKISFILVLLFIPLFITTGCSKKMSTDEFEEITVKTRRELFLNAMGTIANSSRVEQLQKAIDDVPNKTGNTLKKHCMEAGFTLKNYKEKKENLDKEGYEYKTTPYIIPDELVE